MVASCICKVPNCPCLKHQGEQCDAAVNKAGSMCAGCKLQVPYAPVGGFRFGPTPYQAEGQRACGDGPLPLPCSLPVPRVLDVKVTATVIHRVWLNFTGMPYILSPLYAACLQLWSPCKQILWTMGEVNVGKRIIGLSLRKIPEEILQYSVGHWLSTMLVVPLIKDYVALMIVHAHGGFFIDMDIAPLGKVLPDQDFLFVEEPTKPEGHAFHRKALSLNFGFFKAPTGCQWLLELAQRIRKHWIDIVSNCMRGDRSTWPQFYGPWGQVAAVVMWNQKELTKAVGQHVDRSHVWKAIHFIPCNYGLKSWAPSRVLEQEIMDTSFTLNLWGSQWNSQLQVDALCFASALCLSRLSHSARIVSDMTSVELRLWLIDHHAMDDVQEVVSKRQRVA